MNIDNCNFEDLYTKGVYSITNLKTNKIYIGSTSQYFYRRWSQHINCLKTQKHKNKDLQTDFNNSSENNFKFTILKIFDVLDLKEMLDYEELLISKNIGEGCYNINPYAAKPFCFGKTAEKRLLTLSKSNKIASEYYLKVKNQEIQIEDVPKKYFKKVIFYITNKIWNKGLTKEDIDYSFLRGVPKTITEKWNEGRRQSKITQRNKSLKINIYDYRGLYLCTFRSIADIVEFSRNKNHFLPLILISPGKRKSRKQVEGVDIFKLGYNNIKKVCDRGCKHHKGLIFRYDNKSQDLIPLTPNDMRPKQEKFKYFYFKGELLLSEEILIEKLDNIGEVFQNLQDNTEIIKRNKNLLAS
jgi:group I intron endonuclease